jgi:hypothetical protein
LHSFALSAPFPFSLFFFSPLLHCIRSSSRRGPTCST